LNNAKISGKTLAVILNAEQNEVVKNLLITEETGGAFIGGRRTGVIGPPTGTGGRGSTYWKWINGDPWNYNNFTGDEPNNELENVVSINDTGSWNDIQDITQHSAIYMTITKNWANAYIRDLSVGSIELSVNLNPLNDNNGSLGITTNRWGSAYINNLDVSFINDIDVLETVTSTNFYPLYDNFGGLGLIDIVWGNAYIRDLSVGSIDVSVNLNMNVSGGGAITNISKISSAPSNYKITTTNRLYQEISGDISWNAVNGYYGLAKDAYPALDPSSSGIKAVSNLTYRISNSVNNLNSICWSASYERFILVGNNNTIMTSPNGINWTQQYSQSTNSVNWVTICWSQELNLFVAVNNGGTIFIRSNDGGITWYPQSSTTLGGEYMNICWSSQLELFVAVSSAGDYQAWTSSNGEIWRPRLPRTTNENSQWRGVCWSPQLGIFLAVASSAVGLRYLMTSRNGLDWTTQIIDDNIPNYSLCWSAELGIFVVCGVNRVLISYDGINWTSVPCNFTAYSVCWVPELCLFVAAENNNIITSPNGINWTLKEIPNTNLSSICWSPELGIFSCIGETGVIVTSSLKGRPPTSYNIFDSIFNSINQTGNWTFSKITMPSANIIDLLELNSINGTDYNNLISNIDWLYDYYTYQYQVIP
jgi:hypothetical protein